MFEGQIEETLLLEAGLPIETLGDGAFGDVPGALIAEKRLGGVAINITGKLVKQQQQGQRPFRRLLPGIKPTYLFFMNGDSKTQPNLVVEGFVLLEPEVSRARCEPECQDIAWCGHDLVSVGGRQSTGCPIAAAMRCRVSRWPFACAGWLGRPQPIRPTSSHGESAHKGPGSIPARSRACSRKYRRRCSGRPADTGHGQPAASRRVPSIRRPPPGPGP